MAIINNPIIFGGGGINNETRLYQHKGATNPVTLSYKFTNDYKYVLVVATGAEGTNQNPRAQITYNGSGQLILDERNQKQGSVMLSTILIKDVKSDETVSFNGTWHTIFNVYKLQ